MGSNKQLTCFKASTSAVFHLGASKISSKSAYLGRSGSLSSKYKFLSHGDAIWKSSAVFYRLLLFCDGGDTVEPVTKSDSGRVRVQKNLRLKASWRWFAMDIILTNSGSPRIASRRGSVTRYG